MKNPLFKLMLILLCLPLTLCTVHAQKAYFIDGFHGGVWGHYPQGYTSYIMDQLKLHPDWKINLEIEPMTWDRVEVLDKKAYNEFKTLFSNQSSAGRIEYVNPSYAQSYLWNISGESIIRQFSYGIRKLRTHFPNAVFTTYSSEEPCFTSALPQLLKSFGFKYVSLKNPNTCWGGYTRPFGGEVVNWVGPDGTKILTAPRYEVELLKPHSTWETIGNANSTQYIKSAFDYGIQHPVGMCLQDAGWRHGPWLSKRDYYKPTIYTTWRNYFENIADTNQVIDWQVSQEDILVSLVWGSQVLQDVAQNVRRAENKIVQAEKIAVINYLNQGISYPYTVFDSAWKMLLLSQHHDCWIVPYNKKEGKTWADKVNEWTALTIAKSDSIMNLSTTSSLNTDKRFIKVYNTTGMPRDEWVQVTLPTGWKSSNSVVVDKEGNIMPSQTISSKDKENDTILFKASVPSFGYQIFKLEKGQPSRRDGANITILKNGNYQLETDLYKLIINPEQGGAIKHLIAKKLNNKDFVDQFSERKFNELRGDFYKEGGFQSSTSHPALIKILEDGPALISVAVKGKVSGNPYTQILTLVQGQKRIDLRVVIDWKENEKIGAFEEKNYEDTNLRKAFYNDRYKLLTLFPLNLKKQKVYKNAPFDVTESKLKNTFFNTWDSIKNNIILNWVDVTDGNNSYGCALYSDHTTSYTHGLDFPLGLSIQYAGKGLWGRDYSITHPTDIHYALIPHKGDWKQADLWAEGKKIKEPLLATIINKKPVKDEWRKSFIHLQKNGWILTSCYLNNGKINLRIFNSEGDDQQGTMQLGFAPEQANLIQLNGGVIKKLPITKKQTYNYHLQLKIPQFGIRTIQLSKRDSSILKFADPLQDNMVVQQNKPLKIWGKALSGEKITIHADWLKSPVSVIADSTNHFMGIIEVPNAEPGDYTRHTISIKDEDTIVYLKNILIGDVWFCSGQSNMQFSMKEVLNAKEEVAAADYPHIRLLNVALNFSDRPIQTMKGKWQECTPGSVKDFSAVSYYFGRKIYNKLNIPIGLIFSGIGASAAQAYVPENTLAADPLLDSVYLQPYLRSEKSKEKITAGFTFEKVTRPFLLYNALIHPFINLSVKGICWYQGASNRKERDSYTQLMYALIKSWRKNFSQGNLPFYYVQVAPFFYDNTDSTLAGYAFFREMQEKISRLNNTAMVVTMDVGEAKNLHPTNKKPVGLRLAKIALNRTYGFLNVAYRGPHYQSVRFVHDTAIISFKPETIKGGLQTNDGRAPEYFFVAGKDKVFYPGKAAIHGDKIYVVCSEVTNPVAVRYAFTNFPVTNLENGEGLPAVPFRTDHWKENKTK